jgi:hypothetical protein
LLLLLLLLAIARTRAGASSRAGGRGGSRGEDGSGSGLGRSGSGGGGGLRELALLVRELPRRVLLRLLSLQAHRRPASGKQGSGNSHATSPKQAARWFAATKAARRAQQAQAHAASQQAHTATNTRTNGH